MFSPLFSKSRRLKLPPRAGSGQQDMPVGSAPAKKIGAPPEAQDVDLGFDEGTPVVTPLGEAPVKPKWDMTWSKPKLLAACAGMSLSVEDTDTKAVLLAKLIQANQGCGDSPP